MTFAEAAKRQYRYSTIYAVYLVGPNGEREEVGTTQRKSGNGLVGILRREYTQERLRRMPDAATATFQKTADCLLFSNGWRLEFGGTIRQEAL